MNREHKIKRARRLAWRREDGVALVEFTLVLPLLLLVLFGMLEFGRAFNYWIDENHLANIAARWAVVDTNPGAPDTTLQEYIRTQADTDELRDGGSESVPGPLKVCISFPEGSSEVGDPVEVTVATDFNWMPFLDLDAASTTLKGSATMRLEREPSEYSADGEDCAGSA